MLDFSLALSLSYLLVTIAPTVIASPAELQAVESQLGIGRSIKSSETDADRWLPPDLFVPLQRHTRDWLEVNHYERWRNLRKVCQNM